MKAESECYGNMFPDVLRFQTNRPLPGKVLTGLLKTTGLSVQERAITVDETQWQKCIACESYRHCYDLSLAKLLLAHALS